MKSIMRFCLRSCCLLAVVLAVTVNPARGQEPTWKAGVAKAIITPEKGVWLAGYGSKRPPDGKLHELWIKALALEDPKGNLAVLVTSDFQGVPKEMSDRVFVQLKNKLKLERHQVMITFSHNHCGPRLGLDLVDYYPIEAEQVKLVDEYTSLMETKMVEMIAESLTKLTPATLAIGEGRTTFAVNRRNNRESDVPLLLAKGEPLKGPVDHSVPVMTVSGPDRKLVAIVFGYACHPTTLSFTKWCGDYPGFAQIAIEKNHPGALAMFVNTCGGDQNPLPRRKVELCEKYGHMLADAVEEALKKPLKSVSAGLRTAFEYVELPYDQVITREELQTFTKDQNAIRKRWAERMLKKLDGGEKFAPTYPYPLHAWRLGKEMLVIGMGAETVVDYAIRFKVKYGPGTWVCGYADDMISYIPSRRVWLEGGYEGGSNLYEYGRPALRWAGDVEERIAESVDKLVKAVREKAPQKKAFVIGIDGCRPDALLAAKAPNLQKLIENGAFSDKAQTGDMTASGSGWGSLLTGVWREKHGVRGNDFKLSNFAEFPDMLARVKKARPSSFVASIVHWAPIQQQIVKKADVTVSYKTDAEVAKAAIQLLSEKNPDLLFVHLDDVDGAGHKYGFHPTQPKYLAAIEKADEYVGALLKAVKDRKSFDLEDWLIIVSTDHGGSGKGHGQNIPEHRTIFLLVAGKSAARGTIEPAPGIVDIAPTVFQHLDIPINPKWSLDGKAVGLKATASPTVGQVRDSVAIANRKLLPADRLDCERIALGDDDDYKPDLVLLPNGELILVAFHQHKKEGNKVLEQNLLFRSRDGGKTWSKPEKLAQLGREPYLTVLKDGTLFMTGHLLANDVRNQHGYIHGYLHRTTDAGKSWESIRIESEGIKPKASNHSTRNVLQLADGTLLLGVDYDGGDGPFLMWRSKDNGKTWDKTGKCEPKDFKSKYGFFGGETWLWQARSGKIWALVRVDSNELPIKDRPIKAGNDQSDHFILFSSADRGKTFDRIRDFGDYGEMYMSILRLQDKRLLLTFTVRDLNPPLEVRAIPGLETDDGFEFDFAKDRVILDTKTGKRPQGGGFGPTVQLKDGTLVTSYSYRSQDNKTHLEVVRWKLPTK